MKYKRLIVIVSVVGMLLLIPLIAMQFTNEVNWNLIDFITMGILLSGTILLCDLVIRTFNQTFSKIVICSSIVLVFLLVWAELAVGIFGTPFAGT